MPIRFELMSRPPKRNCKLGVCHRSSKQLIYVEKAKWVLTGPSEQPQRKPGVREISSFRPQLKVHSCPRKTAEFLGFQGPIAGQRECRPKASWRRERNPGRTLSAAFSMAYR